MSEVPFEQYPRAQEPAEEGLIYMSDQPAKKSADIVKINFRFKRELAEKIEGNLANYCYQCGACVGDCPAAHYDDRFNPREIMLKVLYGLEDELLGEDSVLWLCTNCYNCAERCPQDVKPAEVIISLKNMLADRGFYPRVVKGVIEAFEETGRTVKLSTAIDNRRAQFGLPPMEPLNMDEIALLFEEPGEEDID